MTELIIDEKVEETKEPVKEDSNEVKKLKEEIEAMKKEKAEEEKKDKFEKDNKKEPEKEIRRTKLEKQMIPLIIGKRLLSRYSLRVSDKGAFELCRILEEEGDRISRKASEIIKLKKKKTIRVEDVRFAWKN